MDYDKVLSKYINKENISSDEVLECIDAIVGKYNFCIWRWIKVLIERPNKKCKTHVDQFYSSEKIEEKWKEKYEGKITTIKEITDRIKEKNTLFKRKRNRIVDIIRPNSKIFCYDPERVVNSFEDVNELDKVVSSLESYLGIPYKE